MQVEELLALLKEKQMDDEAIKALLSDAIASLEGPVEEPCEDANCDKEDKMKNVFGI